MDEESAEKLLGGIIGKLHELFDDSGIVLAQNHIKVIQIADFRDGMAQGYPVHVDQQRFSLLQEHVPRVEIAVDQGAGLGKGIDQRRALLGQDPIFTGDAAADVFPHPVLRVRETVALLGRDAVDQPRQIGHAFGVNVYLAGRPGDAV